MAKCQYKCACAERNSIKTMDKMTKGENTGKLLYETALELFRERGYDNVSVAEIARKAGVAKGTFYVHYASKAAIITRLFQEYDNHYNTLEIVSDSSVPVTERLGRFIKASCDFTEQVTGVDTIRVLYLNQLVSGQIEQDALRQDRSLYKILYKILKEGQDTGVFRSDLPLKDMVEWIIRSMRGTFYEWAMKEGSFPLSEECLRYIRVLVNGFEVQH